MVGLVAAVEEVLGGYGGCFLISLMLFIIACRVFTAVDLANGGFNGWGCYRCCRRRQCHRH